MSLDDVAKDVDSANEFADEKNVTEEKIGGLFPLPQDNGKRTPYGARNYIVICSTPQAAVTIRERLLAQEYDIIHVAAFENAPRYLSLAYKGEDRPQLPLLRTIASIISDVDSKAEASIPANRQAL